MSCTDYSLRAIKLYAKRAVMQYASFELRLEKEIIDSGCSLKRFALHKLHAGHAYTFSLPPFCLCTERSVCRMLLCRTFLILPKFVLIGLNNAIMTELAIHIRIALILYLQLYLVFMSQMQVDYRIPLSYLLLCAEV